MLSKTITSSMVRKYIRPRKSNSRKGYNGKVLVVGGSYMYHGAPILSSLAALRTGCDLVYTAVPKVNAQATRAASADLIVIPLADSKLTRGSVNKLLGQIPAGIDSATIGMGLAVQDIEATERLHHLHDGILESAGIALGVIVVDGDIRGSRHRLCLLGGRRRRLLLFFLV